MQEVSVGAEIPIVNIIHLTSGFSGHPNGGTLDAIRNDATIQKLRNDAGADLVAMITGDDPTGRAGGIAYLRSHESVTSHTQLPFFAFTHEIGHNFGAGRIREFRTKDIGARRFRAKCSTHCYTPTTKVKFGFLICAMRIKGGWCGSRSMLTSISAELHAV